MGIMELLMALLAGAGFILALLLYLVKQLVNLSFLLVKWGLLGLSKLFKIPQINRGNVCFERVRKALNDYFGKAIRTRDTANRIDFLVGLLWSIAFAIVTTLIWVTNWGMMTWNYLQQFNSNRPYTPGPLHYEAPSQSLIIGFVFFGLFTLYWLVPLLSLVVRRCRAIGNWKLFFILFVPFGNIILTILCLFVPGRFEDTEETRAKLKEERKREMRKQMAQEYYADRD